MGRREVKLVGVDGVGWWVEEEGWFGVIRVGEEGLSVMPSA